MTDMMYNTLLGHTGLYDEGEKLHSVKEVADFILTHDCGYIAEADGTPLSEDDKNEIPSNSYAVEQTEHEQNYPESGLLKSQTDSLNHTTRYAHNTIGQIISKTDADNKVT